MGARLYGDWRRAGKTISSLTKLAPYMMGRMKENGEIILDKIVEHIEDQDLPWTSLSERTIELKDGDDRIYIESGELKESLGVRKIKSSKNQVTYFIGASPWKTHKQSGEKFSDLMIWLEYGTENMPPRPLIEPSYEEVKEQVKKNIADIMKNAMKGGI